ncbi:enhancer of polycomb-like-domain-containing protein [Butyriboletus roseoflavus]|nr:enhancer of polycomb-like-domain-containing protein [Butyriboletus roseoflavus]
MPRNHNLGTSALRNRNRVTNKTRLRVVHGSIDAEALSFDEDEEKARIVSTAGVDAEDANEHHLQAVLSAASQRHQSVGRSTRGATDKVIPVPAAYIPTPDSTGLVDNYAELYPSNRWTQPDAYVRSSETVEEALSSGLIDSFTYYMDERDKEWLDRNNEEARGEGTSVQGAVSTSGATIRSCPQRSAKAKGKEPESAQAVAITEDEFELVMGIFEKVTHDKTEFLHHGLGSGMTFPPFSDYQDIFSTPLPPSVFASFIAPFWIPPPVHLLRLAKVIYPYWRERRIERGGHRIIPTLNFDEADVINESYICFRRREIKSVRKTRASQATSSDKLLRLQSELAQSLELAKTLLTRENLKKENAQQVVQVWEKRLEFAELKRKFPALGTKEDEELLHEKERVTKKPRVESTNRITGLKIRTRESGDSGTPSLQTEAAIRPRERLTLINAAIERDLTRRKERDHGYEDIIENPYQRPSLPYTRRYWKAIPPSARSSKSSSPDTDVERGIEHLRYLRRRVTRSGNTMVDRRDAFSRRHGFSPTTNQPHRSFGRRLEEGLDENDEDMRRLRERWRFDEDDDPLVAPEGIDEQDRVLVDDFSPKHLRHLMTLLTDSDQMHINNDATLVLVSTEGRQQSVVPFRTGAQQPFIRRDAQTPRAFANGISQLATSRQMTSVPLSAVPNGVPIAMQTHMKTLQPQSATPRISHTAALRPPGPPQIMNMIPATPLSLTPPPQVITVPTASANGTVGSSPSPVPPLSDTDSVKLVSTPNGNATKGALANGTNQHAPDPIASAATESQQPAPPTGSPVRQKADVQQPVSIPLNGYHIPINGYTIPNAAAYMHPRPPNGLTPQQMQNLKLALAQGQDVNAVMHGTQGRPIQTPYVGHLVPNGTHYNMQMAAGACQHESEACAWATMEWSRATVATNFVAEQSAPRYCTEYRQSQSYSRDHWNVASAYTVSQWYPKCQPGRGNGVVCRAHDPWRTVCRPLSFPSSAELRIVTPSKPDFSPSASVPTTSAAHADDEDGFTVATTPTSCP